MSDTVWMTARKTLVCIKLILNLALHKPNFWCHARLLWSLTIKCQMVVLKDQFSCSTSKHRLRSETCCALALAQRHSRKVAGSIPGSGLSVWNLYLYSFVGALQALRLPPTDCLPSALKYECEHEWLSLSLFLSVRACNWLEAVSECFTLSMTAEQAPDPPNPKGISTTDDGWTNC